MYTRKYQSTRIIQVLTRKQRGSVQPYFCGEKCRRLRGHQQPPIEPGHNTHSTWHLRAPIRQRGKETAPRMASAGSYQAMTERDSTPHGICGLLSSNDGKGQHPAWHLRAPIRQWGKGAAPRMASAGSYQAMTERDSTPHGICGLLSSNEGKGQHPAWHLRAPIRQWGKGAAPRMASAGSYQAMRERDSTPHGICGLQ